VWGENHYNKQKKNVQIARFSGSGSQGPLVPTMKTNSGFLIKLNPKNKEKKEHKERRKILSFFC